MKTVNERHEPNEVQLVLVILGLLCRREGTVNQDVRFEMQSLYERTRDLRAG